ncbi:MAG TPA: TetR family transcriptional regulator [Roseiflexaceae bacterium]|nr:TetR family transcriptional regulator [Roseiflexaceae bacterium]
MRVQRNSDQTRVRLLQAAVEAMQQSGPSGLTLDQVARQAGVSKGGLLHHFPSKEALLEALVRRLFTDFAAAVEARLAQEPPGPGRLLRAYIHANLDDTQELSLEFAAPLLAAMVDQPGLATLMRDDALAWQARLDSDGLTPARAAVIRMAADAYWADRLIGVAPRGDALVALRDELLALTQVGVR